MNTQTNFDILYIIDSLKKEYEYILEIEIQNLLYLSSLLSLFDGNPHSTWGYFFMNIDGKPFCEEIPMQLDLMCKRNILIRNGEKYKLSEKGEKFFSSIYNFTSTEGRKKYLKACTEALLTIPLPILTNSIGKESMIMDLNKTPRRELLGNGISINLLYKDFKGLKSVLGENSTDLWIVSTLWIKYLNNIAERGGNID